MTRYIHTDPPDPNCQRCKGKGVLGGCGLGEQCTHMHTMSFCECVNERHEVQDE